MKNWTKREIECAADHGWKFDKDGMLVLTQAQFADYAYHGYSDISEARTLVLPSESGVCLIFEGKHFIVRG